MANSQSGESMLTRSMRVIEAFTGESEPLTVTEVANRADLPVTTAHRIVGELVDLRVLTRDAERKVRLGTRLWEISQHASHEMRLRKTALPVMERLQSAVQSHVQLAVISHGQVLYLERLSRPGSVKNIAHPASRIDAHLCSPGLVLLAWAPPAVQMRAMSTDFDPPTPTAIKSGNELRARLAETRRQRFAVSNGMLISTSKGVAVPIVADGRSVVAALSIVIPVEQDHTPLVPLLLRASKAISSQLGTQFVTDESVWMTQSLEAGQHLAEHAVDQVKGRIVLGSFD